MESGLLVFAVDDERGVLDILSSILEGVCRVETFESAQACLERAGETKPDVFVLDVTMPDMDGYALCKRLKEDWDTQDIPVIFISAHDDTEVRLRCYEAGGDDFLQKPIEPVELISKLNVAERVLKEKHGLREQVGYAQRTAMTAMVSMGELGVVLQFLRNSFACATVEELAKAVIESAGQYELQVAVQIRMGDQILSLSQNGHELPLEVSVLNHVRTCGRIFQFKSRCAFNYGHVTLLVNNMPLDDAERSGRIRDNVALLAEGADARVSAIEADLLAHSRRTGIESALPTLYTTLEGVQNNYRSNCFQLTQVMIDFEESLTRAFVHLGLTNSQEEFVSNLSRDFMGRVVATQDASLHIVGDLERLAEHLKQLVKN